MFYLKRENNYNVFCYRDPDPNNLKWKNLKPVLFSLDPQNYLCVDVKIRYTFGYSFKKVKDSWSEENQSFLFQSCKSVIIGNKQLHRTFPSEVRRSRNGCPMFAGMTAKSMRYCVEYFCYNILEPVPVTKGWYRVPKNHPGERRRSKEIKE